MKNNEKEIKKNSGRGAVAPAYTLHPPPLLQSKQHLSIN